ncbi:MAG TPA: type IV pilus modification protein PilV [Frateuria sp.]|uniref:type IV pilus modification protein PilV n=1 Tax=Frateuria sp. TaxID=2211372 RepID=UPI002DF5DCCF|nr:type IV pilus modification protein PilV [Frateuria sp.]
MNRYAPCYQRGVSLIEVLVAVLIFSVGMIGMAGLLVMATRSNHTAYQRTQVTFLAGAMADRMRANPVGVWNGSYNGAYPVTGNIDCQTSACSPLLLAQRDRQLWSSMLTTLLPNAGAAISCQEANTLSYTVSADQINRRPPYGGHCALTITWNERKAGDTANRDTAAQTYAWEFQP